MKNNLKSLLTLLLLVFFTGCQTPSSDTVTVSQSDSTKEVSDPGDMSVTFLDIGQGDCTIVQSQDAVMLIDAGDNGAGDLVVSYLSTHGITKLDYFILTHPDADHVGGADTVIDAVSVDHILMPDVKNDTKTFSDVEQAISANSIPVTHPSVSDTYTLGDAQFTVLCPEKVSTHDLNNSSVGIKLNHGEKSFVLCGDAEEKSETAMAAQFGSALECDVLKCGHHGSSTATCDAFLEAADPTWAVISCGNGNRYGHPHAEVLSKLEDNDIQVYRTDRLGTITAVSDGKNITWSTEN